MSRYKYEENEQEEEERAFIPKGWMSEDTAFMHWATEFGEVDGIVDKPFLKRNRYDIMNFSKFTPQAFYINEKQIHLRKRKNMNIKLAKNNELWETVEETILENQDDVAVTRGWQGSFTNALHTRREEHKIEEENIKKKFGRLSGFLGKKKTEEEEQQ